MCTQVWTMWCGSICCFLNNYWCGESLKIYIQSNKSKKVTCFLSCIVLKNRTNFPSLQTQLESKCFYFRISLKYTNFTQQHTHPSTSVGVFAAITRYTHTLYTRLKHTRRRICIKKVRKIEGPVASAASGKGPPKCAKRVWVAQSAARAPEGR